MKHLIFALLFSSSLHAEKIIMREFSPKDRVRVTSFAKEETIFAGRNRKSILAEVLPNGSHVQEGDVVARLNDRSIRQKIETLKNERKSVKIHSDRNVIKINNDLKDLQDSFRQEQENLRSMQAKLNTLQKVPLIEDVKIAKSSLAVAQVNLNAAEDEYTKGKSRLAKQFISSIEFAKIEKDYKLRKNELEQKQLEFELISEKSDPRELEIAQLRLANAKLKIQRAEKNLKDSEIISASKISGVKKKLKIIDTQLERYNKHLDDLTFTAPFDGYLSHKQFSSPVQAGLVIYWGRAFMSMPDLKSTAFQALLPESLLNFYPKKSKAKIIINGHENHPINTLVTKVSATPEDATFRTEAGWGKKPSNTGVKVYLMELTPVELPDWLRPGMSGYAELLATQEKQLPSIELKYIHYKDNKSYFALNGQMTQVDGVAQGLYFFLNDPDLVGKKVSLEAPWSDQTLVSYKQDEDGNNSSTQLLSVSGELHAVKENAVITPKLDANSKITWLLDEEAKVKKGDLVARLDTTELHEKIEKLQTAQTELRESLVTAEVQVQKNKDELAYKQKTEKNDLKIAELTKGLVLRTKPTKDRINKEFSVKSLSIELAHNKLLLSRTLSQPKDMQVPSEITELQLKVNQFKLRLRKAEIDFQVIKDKPNLQEKSEALMAYEASLANILKSRGELPVKITDSQHDLESAQNKILENQEEIKRLTELEKSYQIYAPSSGTLHYKKLWSSEGVKKVEPGFDVGAWQTILSIPKTDEMIAKVLVPEKQFKNIQIGDKIKIKIPSLNSKVYTGKVSKIDFSFISQESIDAGKDLYNSQEPSGDTHFRIIVKLPPLGAVKLKPGALAKLEIPLRSRGVN